MTRLRKTTELIPAEYRKEIIDLQLVEKAKAQTTDGTMQYLGVIWKNYIEPDYDPVCNHCCIRVLDNLKLMLPVMIEIERESNLLKAL